MMMVMVMITSTDNCGRVERSDWSRQRQQEKKVDDDDDDGGGSGDDDDGNGDDNINR